MKIRRTTKAEHANNLCGKTMGSRESTGSFPLACDRPATWVCRKRFYCGLHVPKVAKRKKRTIGTTAEQRKAIIQELRKKIRMVKGYNRDAIHPCDPRPSNFKGPGRRKFNTSTETAWDIKD